MVQDIFSYLYPMPDDVAQSMLISETETNIHIRPTNSNSLKCWLHNKLLRNLATQRKTLILVDKQEHVKLFEELIELFGIQSLCFNFHHSRSQVEKNLIKFSPITVSGSLNIRKFKDSCNHFHSITNHLIQSVEKTYLHGKYSADPAYLTLCRYIKLNKSEFYFLPQLNSRLNLKEYQYLKHIVEALVKNSAGQLYELHPLRRLNHFSFELFLPEEAWTYFSYFLSNWYNKGKTLLGEFRMVHKEIKAQISKKLFLRKLKLIELWNSTCQTSNDPCSWSVEHQLTCEKINSFLKEYSGEQIRFSEVDNFSEIDLKVILDKTVQIYLSDQAEFLSTDVVNESEFNASLTTLDSKLKTWYQELVNSRILQDVHGLELKPMSQQVEQVQQLMVWVKEILEHEEEFPSYYEWMALTNQFTSAQNEVLDSIKHLPKPMWAQAIEYIYLNDLFGKSNFLDDLVNDQSISECKKLLLELKDNFPKYLHSIYEKWQYLALQQLEQKNDSIFQTIKHKVDSKYTLSEFYQNLDSLSNVFPVIILESSHPEFFPNNLDAHWDEIWNLSPTIDENFINRFMKSCHHFINIYSDYSTFSQFNIALSQSAPIKLKDSLLETASSDNYLTIQSIAAFIYNNFPQMRIFVNNDTHCISFLPRHLEPLILQWSESNWNQISLDEPNALDKLTEILLYKGTTKKIWLADGFFSPNIVSIQQMEWQWHFLKCMQLAGFHVENFSMTDFLANMDLLSFKEQQLFVKSRRIFTAKS
ncbi:MAG: hypothetical protein IPO62_15815 [Saprospiraceae bacterium]|nr:hypothetical protein [Saprospiraceae bacterium]